METLPISQAEAKARGLKHFFTGVPCKHGHLSKRYTSIGSCYECQRLAFLRWRSKEENAARDRQDSRAWQLANRPKVIEAIARREAAIDQRTPAWADREAIRAIYEEAARLTLETGVAHHVDHCLPLRGKYVSGLHVANNLRAITADANRRKSNLFTPE